MKIVTGYTGESHITAQQDRDRNAAIFGGNYIIDVGSRFNPVITDNTHILLSDGAIVCQGLQATLDFGIEQIISITAGESGKKRYDLICAEYRKDSAGVESCNFIVIRGTPAETPTDPSYTTGVIKEGSLLVQVPVFRAVVDGTTLSAVQALLPVSPSIHSLKSGVDTLLQRTTSLTNEVHNQFQMQEHKGTVSIENNTHQTLVDVYLEPGKYIVQGFVMFPETAAGYRRISLNGFSTAAGFWNETKNPTVGQNTYCHVMTCVSLENRTHVTLKGFQNSGATLPSCSYGLSYVKLDGLSGD